MQDLTPGQGRGSRAIAERTACVQRVAPIWAISPAAWTAVPMTANGSGTRRPASGDVAAVTGGEAVSAGAAAVVAAGRRRGAERGFDAVRAADLGFAFDEDEDEDEDALVVRDEAPLLALDPDARARGAELAFLAAGALELAADARPRERAGVSEAAAASGAFGVEAAPADAGLARLALRRAGRVRGRLFRTSRSPSFDESSLGGMARLLPIHSRGA
jgi:hypothetical protein